MKHTKGLGAPRWAWVLWIAVVVGSLLAVPHLQNRIAIHFGPDGKPSGYATRWAVLIQPALMFGVLVGWQLLWRIDPRRRNYAAMAATYLYLGGLMAGFLALLQAFILLHALHRMPWNPSRLLGGLLGLLVALLSNVLPRLRPNWWLGIRTPWTLSSETVWRRTHRLGGQTGVLAGVAVIAGSLALPPAWVGIGAGAIVLLWALAISGASYWFFVRAGVR